MKKHTTMLFGLLFALMSVPAMAAPQERFAGTDVLMRTANSTQWDVSPEFVQVRGGGRSSGRSKGSSGKRSSKSKSAGIGGGLGAMGGSSDCPCGSANVCVGPRGGRYCLTSSGNKRYGV